MHLNKSGKEWLPKVIVTQICRLVKSKIRAVPVIALNWKGEPADKQNTVHMHTATKTAPDQNNSSQTRGNTQGDCSM
jgi:hypothetical protein